MELSIVLVIIGLIVGGVLAGQTLIQAAKIRAQMTQLDQFDAGLNAFRAKFDCLPGDCTAAAAPSGAPTATVIAGTAIGDGNIDYQAGILSTDESQVAWPQMATAGVVAGTYTPVVLTAFPGSSLPTAKGGGNVLIGGAGGSTFYIISSYTTGSATTTRVISAGMAAAIDKKRDDGLPLAGNVIAMAALSSPFSTSTVDPGALPSVAANCVGASGSTTYAAGVDTALCILRVKASG